MDMVFYFYFKFFSIKTSSSLLENPSISIIFGESFFAEDFLQMLLIVLKFRRLYAMNLLPSFLPWN